MNIIVFACRFEDRNWKAWEHECTAEEGDAVHDSAMAKAQDRLNFGPPELMDYLFGAHYIFEIARGSAERPREADTRVHAVCVDGMLFGSSTQLSQQFGLLKNVA
jgi:hypothetical protein